MRPIPFLLVLFLSAPAWAQPSTDIHVFPIGDDHTVQVAAGWNATATAGYDNQPAFLPGANAFLFTSQRAGDQTEIFRYDLAERTTTRITDTPESEYSPTPRDDGFSTVRVETDTSGTQRLWHIASDGEASLVLPEVRGVGYHAWANDHELLLFIVGEPHTLHRADTRTGTSERILDNPGRALHRIPGQDALTYTRMRDEENWEIVRYDLATGDSTPVAPAPPGSQDLTWTPWGEIWMTADTGIVAWRDDAWVPVADLGLEGLTRLSVSPDGRWLAVVATEAD